MNAPDPVSPDAGPLVPHLLGIAPGSRLLLVASTGGHLAQLVKIAALLGASRTSTWVTFDSPQSRSLLKEYPDVRYVPYVAPRDLPGVLRTRAQVGRITRAGDYAAAISTGAGVALALTAVRRPTRRIYVESVSRVAGPSLTGRLLAYAPGIERRTQHAHWASRKWPFELTLLDDYEVRTRSATSEPRPLSLLVTLGTIRPYRFDALVDSVAALLRPGDEVTWQLGATTRDDLPGTVVENLSREDLTTIAAASDVVISHAGVGTALDLLDLGVRPVLVPRRAAATEHVDDHQAQIAAMLGDRDLATVRHPEELTRADLLHAASKAVGSRPPPSRSPGA